MLLLPAILLTSLSSCVSSDVSNGTASLIVGQLPDMPDPPQFPMGLNWGWSEELSLYTLDDEGVDALLIFRDELYGSRDTCGYLFDLETWQIQHSIVIDRIVKLGL